MRVALFFDGKNHMKDLKRATSNRWLDHGALADWAVKRVGGTHFYAAYYYTGVPNPSDESSDRRALTDLLEELERRPGFFVRRYNRRSSSRECPHCKKVIQYTEEKMVDTSLVADMILFAVRDAYDIAVVFSGDLDIAPGFQAIQSLGKQGWIATFGTAGLSRALVRSAWGSINLLEHIEEFSFGDLTDNTPIPTGLPVSRQDEEVLRELFRAESHFGSGGGFVGAHYFVHRWKGHDIPDAPELRRHSIQRLVSENKVELYDVDGKTAIRTMPGAFSIQDDLEDEDTQILSLPDDLTTVEMKMPPEIRRQVRKKLRT